MLRSHRIAIVLTLLCVATTVRAQEAEGPTPTFSLEAVAVNGTRLVSPTAQLTVGSGSRITAKVFLRDWSPNGEKLRSYQAELDTASFTSGEAGSIKPTQFDELRALGQENPAAAFIDRKEPTYVHRDRLIIPIVDTLKAPGYRWLTVLVDPVEGPISRQDGSKYYLGTVELEVSEDAAGLFTIRFAEGPHTTGLLDPDNKSILPNAYEALEIEVQKDGPRLTVHKSDPPSGAIDARMAFDPAAAKVFDLSYVAGWRKVTLTFNADASAVSAGDFTVRDGTGSAPRVERLEANGNQATLTLTQGIHAGRWTEIIYQPTNSLVRLGYLPGDVNNDRATNTDDVLALADVLARKTELPAYRTDLDRDGATDSGDLATLVELLGARWARDTMRIPSGR